MLASANIGTHRKRPMTLPKTSSTTLTEEEMNAMCDAAEDKEKCREYNMREAEYYDKRAKLDFSYNEMVAKGYTMTADGFWIKE